MVTPVRKFRKGFKSGYLKGGALSNGVKKIKRGQTVYFERSEKQGSALAGSYFECEKCGLRYKQKIWAQRCQEWCSKNKSCNLEITKHVIK